MSQEKIIGRGTWIDKIAHEVIEREKRLGRPLDVIYTESGLGASGFPHVGSMADAVRAYAVTLALRDMGYESHLIAFSDDMDGLRKVPEGIPREMEEYLLQPVSMIPDPFGCHRSYGEHMSGMLIEALETAGIEFIHRSGTEMYRRGELAEEIDTILRNWRRIGEIIYEETGQEKYLHRLPYYPVCRGCGRIYTTVAKEYDPEKRRVRYVCEGGEVRGQFYPGCGYEGWADITKGEGKLSWKSEFAARWRRQGIRFEAYGKDIADSVRVNDRIAEEILGYPPPHHARYELFLDEAGKKIAKSRGNVYTPQVWYRYGSPESLILFLLKRMTSTRKIKVDTVVVMMRELDYYRNVYHGRIKLGNPLKETRMRGLIEYVYKLGEVPPVKVPYEIVLNLAVVAPPENAEEFIKRRLERYGYTTDDEEVDRLIGYALNWVRDYGRPPMLEDTHEIDEKMANAIRDIVENLREEMDGEEIQGLLFETARRHNIPYREFFKNLYMIILGLPRGPRLGPLIKDIGIERVREILMRKIGGGNP